MFLAVDVHLLSRDTLFIFVLPMKRFEISLLGIISFVSPVFYVIGILSYYRNFIGYANDAQVEMHHKCLKE